MLRGKCGNNALGINRAVIRPHAINAAILGIIIEERKVPKRYTRTRTLAFSVVVVDIVLSKNIEYFCSEMGKALDNLSRQLNP